jgi:hypothetical protein
MSLYTWEGMGEGSFFIVPDKKDVGGARRSLRRYLSRPDCHLPTNVDGFWSLRDRKLPDGTYRCTLVFNRTLTFEQLKQREAFWEKAGYKKLRF